ncbi:hypothetical protein F9C11_28795 [Amycolatopsis sp. VS8301801F10]|uniref:hypothetical protein n=1 Tax=Amycolatopsis sp. VS8301801F10 TaxID=2652442 RepID=UPI0038FC46E9
MAVREHCPDGGPTGPVEDVVVFADPVAAERVERSAPHRPRVRIDPLPRISFR